MPSTRAGGRAPRTWMFAALNTVEPPDHASQCARGSAADSAPTERQTAAATAFVRTRLADLSAALDGRDYLENQFTAADLLMTTVLQILRGRGLVEEFPALDAYRRRCESRPAYEKALADQMAPFAQNAPAGSLRPTVTLRGAAPNFHRPCLDAGGRRRSGTGRRCARRCIRVVPDPRGDLEHGTRRFVVPLTIGSTAVEAGLDTGSVGLRVLREPLGEGDVRETPTSESETFAIGRQARRRGGPRRRRRRNAQG